MTIQIRNIQRRNTSGECGALVGNMVLKIEGIQEFQTVSFRCTKAPFHTDGCEFVGKDLVVSRKRP